MLCKLAAVLVGVTANLVLGCSEPVPQSPARAPAQRNLNARTTLVTVPDNGNAVDRSTRMPGGLSVRTRWLQQPSGDAQYSLEDLLQREPDLVSPRPWPGDAIIIVTPDPTIDYKIRTVTPDPSIDYKILIVGPPSGNGMPDLREQLGDMLLQQPGPESQKQRR